MRRIFSLPIVFGVLTGGACTSQPNQEASPDARAAPEKDAGTNPEVTTCQVRPGLTFVTSVVEMRSEGEGFDLDGDGTPDNALWSLAVGTNQGWADSIERGWTVYLIHLVGVDKTVASGLSGNAKSAELPVDMEWFFGEDTDADPTNNVKGDG
ncbi:MAG: hypothetical protein HY698_03980, partial [Deltaproteobacteria bacterium]|nr:hypothetical protein [Deltaproteobacteria bacterium]